LRVDHVFGDGDGAAVRTLARIQEADRREQRGGFVLAEDDVRGDSVDF